MLLRVLPLVLGFGLASSSQATPPSPSDHRGVIDGALEPDRLPETTVWDNVFAALYDLTGGKTDPGDRQVRSFIKGTLFVSDGDATIILRRVAAVRSQISEIERAGEAAHPDDWAPFREQTDRAILAARDDILDKLSPAGKKALLRWVAVVKQGMTHGSDE